MKKKKILSLLLVLCMVLSLLPVSALAAMSMSGEERAETPASAASTGAASRPTGNGGVARLMAEGDETVDGVAKIGDTTYATLQEAINAAQEIENATVVMLADYTAGPGPAVTTGKLTLDLNGYTVAPTQVSPGTKYYVEGIRMSGDADLTVVDTSADKTGKIKPNTTKKYINGIVVLDDAKLTVDSITIDTTTTPYANAGIMTNGSGTTANSSITIKGDTVITADYTGIYQPSPATLTILGGKISAYTGVEVRGGTLNIPAESTAEITGDYTIDGVHYGFSCNPSGSGNTTYGAGVAVSQHTTNADIKVNIAGGTLKGYYPLFEQDLQDGNAENVSIAITGGTFESLPYTEYTADPYRGGNGKEGQFNISDSGYTEPAAVTVKSENSTATVEGGTFSSDVSAYCVAGKCQNAEGVVGDHVITAVDAAASTCSKRGNNAYYTCTFCGKAYKDELGETETTVAAETLELDPDAHSYGDWADAEDGNHKRVCAYDETHVETVAHTFETYVSNNDATCTENATETAKCESCDATDTREIPDSALGHTPADAVRENEVAATCSAEGSYDEVVYCSVCKAELSRESKTIDKLDHTPADAVRENEIAATCSAEGSYDEVVYCSVCKAELSREGKTIDKKDHTVVIDEAEEPTCTEPGYTAGSHCSVCHVALEPQTAIDPKGHSYGDPVAVWTDDHSAVTVTVTCADCDDEQTATAEGDAVTGEVTVPAKRGVAGERTFTATVTLNDQEYTFTATEVIPALPSNQSSGGGSAAVRPVEPVTPPAEENDPSDDQQTTPPAEEDQGDEQTTPPEEDLDEPDVPLSGKPFLFEDVAENDWYYDAVKYVFNNDLMEGVNVEKTHFDPKETSTRGSIVTILYRLEDQPDAVVNADFSDVADSWYTDAVNWGAEKGIVLGLDDGTFRPDQAVDREQLVAILFRYAAGKGMDTTARAELADFADVADVSDWAKEPMQWAVAAGLIRGRGNDTLAPQGIASRGELAAIIQRFLTAQAEQEPAED